MISNAVGLGRRDEEGILLNERSRIVGVWFAHGVGCDWMACVWRDDPRHSWTCRARTRIVVDDVIGPASRDRKRWITSVIPGGTTEDAILPGMDHVAERMAHQLRIPKENISRMVIRGGVADFLDTFKRPEYASFAHSFGFTV